MASTTTASTRDGIRAAEALAHLVQQSIDASVQLDRILRLGGGDATERVELPSTITDQHFRALVASNLPQDAC